MILLLVVLAATLCASRSLAIAPELNYLTMHGMPWMYIDGNSSLTPTLVYKPDAAMVRAALQYPPNVEWPSLIDMERPGAQCVACAKLFLVGVVERLNGMNRSHVIGRSSVRVDADPVICRPEYKWEWERVVHAEHGPVIEGTPTLDETPFDVEPRLRIAYMEAARAVRRVVFARAADGTTPHAHYDDAFVCNDGGTNVKRAYTSCRYLFARCLDESTEALSGAAATRCKQLDGAMHIMLDNMVSPLLEHQAMIAALRHEGGTSRFQVYFRKSE